jgi:glycosyltransferase involved in cell wall biosynthesis
MKMKLNWFSPLPPASTDIAHYTTRVLAALSERARVCLWTDARRWDESLERHAEVRFFQPDSIRWEEVNQAAMSIYHIGNNPLFHGAIWQVSRRHPGIVVLHDERLHHFFDGLYRVEWRDLRAYLAVMERYYGAEGRRAGEECFLSDARNIDEMAERYPLTELALENALGVITHTRETYERLLKENRWPVAYLPLPFSAGPKRSENDGAASAASQKSVEPPFRLIVFGYLGRNRRLTQLLEALSAFPAREQFRLDIYGQVLIDERPLRSLIRSLGLKHLVKLHGYVPEAQLESALARAALAINLRYPTMGEASGSQLRIWKHALPSLVSRVGWYGALPAEAVAFVEPERETADIQKHLNAFLADPARFSVMGEQGRRLLEEQHAPERYAQGVVEFVAHAQSFRPQSLSSALAGRAGALMSEWLGATIPERVAKKTATEIAEITKR